LAFTDLNTDKYKQVVAHELFHCVQDYSFPNTKPYGTHSWWMEGSADYFSNLVYPQADLEWEFLNLFDSKSPNVSILDMTYENFVFFQFMGNKYSPEVLVDILMRVSAAAWPEFRGWIPTSTGLWLNFLALVFGIPVAK
jgi:hypothetical protein